MKSHMSSYAYAQGNNARHLSQNKLAWLPHELMLNNSIKEKFDKLTIYPSTPRQVRIDQNHVFVNL